MIEIIDMWPAAPVAPGSRPWFELLGSPGQRVAAAICLASAGLAAYAARRLRNEP